MLLWSHQWWRTVTVSHCSPSLCFKSLPYTIQGMTGSTFFLYERTQWVAGCGAVCGGRWGGDPRMEIISVPSLVLRCQCARNTVISRAAPQWLPPQTAASKYSQDVGTPATPPQGDKWCTLQPCRTAQRMTKKRLWGLWKDPKGAAVRRCSTGKLVSSQSSAWRCLTRC